MASDQEIRAGELARLEAVVQEFGTAEERCELELVAAFERLGVTPYGGSLQSRLERVGRRAERRARLKLPSLRCAGLPANRFCACLEKSLDEPGEGGKAAVLRRALDGFHWVPAPSRVERRLDQKEKLPSASEPQSKSSPRREDSEPPRPPAKPEPPIRVVRHFKRWYDDDGDFSRVRF